MFYRTFRMAQQTTEPPVPEQEKNAQVVQVALEMRDLVQELLQLEGKAVSPETVSAELTAALHPASPLPNEPGMAPVSPTSPALPYAAGQTLHQNK